MKRITVKAFTKAEATAQAPFSVLKDATAKWKREGSPREDKALKAFCMEYLKENTKNLEGIGCSITFKAGSADDRKRPYAVTDIKNETGKRKYKKGYQGVDKATGKIMFTLFDITKEDAKKEAKRLYKEEGYRGDLYCKYVKEVVEGEVGAFEVTYTPSKATEEGEYYLFGIEKDGE